MSVRAFLLVSSLALGLGTGCGGTDAIEYEPDDKDVQRTPPSWMEEGAKPPVAPPPGMDAGMDAGADAALPEPDANAGSDAGADAGSDASASDAGADASSDGGN